MEFSDLTIVTDDRLDGLPISYGVVERPAPTSAVVLMPAALPPDRVGTGTAYYPRWSWADEWPESLVLSIADPSVTATPVLSGAWYMHPRHDVLRALAQIVGENADRFDIPHDRIVFYGSSLGGFGSIGAAALLPGARAVAEVPQIDFEHWMPGAVRAVETHLLRTDITAHRKAHPEQVSLVDRLTSAALIPPIHIVSNSTDYSIDDQRQFIAWCASAPVSRIGEQVLEETHLTKGHAVLRQPEAVRRVNP